MEAREEVEETDDQHKLRQLLAGNVAEQAGLVRRLSDAFKRGALTEAVATTTHLTYLAKLEHEIRTKLPIT
jgi:DnaJ-domain-containing protein 1